VAGDPSPKKRERKKKKQTLHSFLIPKLRKYSYWWKERMEALKDAKVDEGLYKCAICENGFPRASVHLDHKEPVVKIEGFTTWDDFINRLYCNKEGFQVLCIDCHKVKTDTENEERKKIRNAKKNKKIP
jgi:hypothetical protein